MIIWIIEYGIIEMNIVIMPNIPRIASPATRTRCLSIMSWMETKAMAMMNMTAKITATAASVAETLKVDEFHAQLLPADKVTEVEKLLQGGTLAFVGDGINDAPVLTRADVGIAMGALGSDAAIEAADVVLMDDKPSKIATAVRIARRTLAIARQNIVFAIGIKVLVLVLATMGLATMWMAVFADVGVTVLAVLNAMRALRA